MNIRHAQTMNSHPSHNVVNHSFVEHLSRLARERPSDRALIVVNAQGETTLDYATLERRSRALASELQQWFPAGERALILLDNDEHYVVAFFACLYAGVIAVPVFPPESAKQQHLARLLAIAADSQAACVLTSTTIIDVVASASEGFGSAELIPVDAVDESRAEHWIEHRPKRGDLAFLQYTSGSTATPKGVMVSHGNLMANERAIETGFSIGADDVFVSWLPLYHDMGLIGGLLQPIYRGIPAVLMSPTFFLQRPVRWLEAISRHRGTISGGPDFAYRLCLERIRDEQLEALDLSSWRVAFSGAEPVRHDTLTGFIERFRPAGFAADTAAPCYGLAEATLLVSCNSRGTGVVGTAFSQQSLAEGKAASAVEGNTLVGCGTPEPGHAIDIVDPEGLHSLPSGEVGEIWVNGPSVAHGYWQNPEATAQAFVTRDGVSWQRTDDADAQNHDARDDRWLRTGDLGFLHEGQLYIAGRIKDLIILRGHNVYPQDIESAIEAEVEAVRKGRVAAFAVTTPEGAEGIGIAAEVSRGIQKLVPAEKLVEALSETVGSTCHEPLSVVLLLNPGGLPKTSSGKLQRSACRQGWEAGSLDAYAIHAFGRFVSGGSDEDAGGGKSSHSTAEAGSETEQALAKLWRQVLRDGKEKPLGKDAHFFASGGNSLAAVQLASRISDYWAIDFSAKSVFEHSSLGAMANEVERISSDHVNSGRSPIPILSPTHRAEPLPLSHDQQRLWFLWQLDPESTAYHIGGVLRLSGHLNIDAMRVAFDDLIARHESLRTLFYVASEGGAKQSIRPDVSFGLEVVDFRGMSAGEAQQHEEDTIRRLNDEPFDLSEGPLLRAALLRLSADVYALIVVMHHIISDGVSMQIMLDELAASYRAQMRGEPVQLPDLSIQYADYAVWQREWLASGEGERQLAYWQQQLGSEHPTLDLPTDHPRQRLTAKRAGQHAFSLPKELLVGLRRLAESQNTSLFTVLLAGFQGLLHRYSGQHEIRVGVPVANRQRQEIEGVIGFFVNTLVLRNDIDSRYSFETILTQCQDSVIGALAHSSLPFEQLVEALQPARSSTHNPLFQVMFNYRQEDFTAFQTLPDLTLTESGFLQQDAQFDLTLEVRDLPDGQLKFSMVYASELFEPETIQRLAGYFETLLQRLLTSPGQALGDIELLENSEQQQLIQWGVNSQGYSDAAPVHHLIEQQTAATPETTALVFEDQSLSYAELNTRANRLAHYLIDLGVKPETHIGIAMERSIEMVVGLLAILKAGGAYVPLDPDYPAERLAYMVEDSGIELLLTQQHLRDTLPVAGSLSVIELDRLNVTQHDSTNPEVTLHGEHLAYVIYTSGSTGRPKGAANRHHALTNRLQWMQEAYGLTVDDVVLQKTPFSFDVSVWEFFWPLIQGARLVMAPPGSHREPAQLVELIRTHGITTLHFVPSMLQAFLAHGEVERCTSLTRLICSGEALPAELQNQVFARLPRTGLYNLYGPTEAAIDVTHWSCQDDGRNHVAIGQPIAGIRTYVLDGDLNLAPPGVAGELYLGGVGLARGYLHRPDLTSERFVADPSAQGERLYRTGDLVRWRVDGQLEYLGRLDHQVKIRGLRIELGEIEAELLAQPEVHEAVVVAQEGPGGSRLVAYVVPQADSELDTSSLREALSQKLPDYMVPGVVVTLEALPLNANGKVDRKALPITNLASSSQYEPPQGEVEEALAAIWSEVLGVEQVGRYDNFFELGGHSLLALKVLEQMRHRGLPVQVRTLFQRPELAAFAQALTQTPEQAEIIIPPNLIPHDCQELQPEMLTLIDLNTEEIGAIEAAVPGGATNIQDIYPLASLQEGILFHHRLQQRGDTYVLLYLLGFDSQERLEAFIAGFNQLIARHDILRTAVLWEGLSEPVQVVYKHAAMEIEWPTKTGETKNCVAGWLYTQVDPEHQRLDVRRAPMLRAVAAYDAEHERWLLQLISHHLVMDHTTLELLMKEIALIQQGREEALPKPLPFRNFVAQARLGVSPDVHEVFFRDWLGDVEEPTAPFGILEVRGDGSDIEEVRLPLEPELARQVRQQAQRHGVSTASLFHLAWALVLNKTTGQDDVVFGTVLFGRMQGTEGAERALGMFINTLPVRITTGAKSVNKCLHQTHDALSELLHHEHASLGLAQHCSGLSGGTPLFSSLLNYRYSSPHQEGSPLHALEGMELLGDQERTNYPITMSVDDLGHGFQLVGQVSRSIGAQRLCDYLSTAIVGIVENLQAAPQQPLSEISLLRTGERQLLSEWGENTQQYLGTSLIHHLIERQAEATPETTALVFEDQSLSYTELNIRANRLAHYLIGLGVKPETRVGIAMERSIEMVVGLLGILKSGGAYVPLDPDYPTERLAYMVEDSGIELLLTQQHLHGLLPIAGGLSVIELDRLGVAHHASTNPAVALHGEHLAYVIYTSGSTGQPKGAANRHHALTNRLQWMQEAYGLTADDAVLQKTPFSFDVSVWEFFWPLMQGARLVMASPGAHREPAQLVELIRTHNITTLHFVPSMLQAFLAYGEIEACTSLRRMVCSGEALPAELQNQVFARLPHTGLYNLYGPTEAAIDVTHWTCQDDGRNQVAIGQPIAGIRTYVLDGDLNLAPPGVPGELYLGGVGLARGYLHRPDLTAERFVADPFAQGERLYRTGDLVRWREGGQLEYLGRLDHQVKIRGLRIELGESEAQLLSQPEVREAVVVAQEGPGGSRLVAYVVPQDGIQLDIDSLREALGQRLPDYMVPGAVVTLDALPLNANGKVDRKALPEPDLISGTQFEPPQGEVEEALAAIWSEVLGTERIGRHDNFFEVGGHSLAAIQISARFTQRFGEALPVRLIFEHPTLAHMATQVALKQVNADGGRAKRLSTMDQLLNELEG
ncbi:non-ribosomal peptide synthetase [Vreelandella titanicae]|uniref:Amino acid adenylation n=1 Tax=Vreelandella titanicae BH1 TaxID=1204738 RepID=L9UBS9_9GAMM|nr:non-ribosomal peptide synthetase [Halomonas titanicae]ELY22071.1 Amino acid adenylation [Halomonas titanicae BH1]NVE90364.1 non-ribosomal peptide synthetase [Halomonas titanicae]